MNAAAALPSSSSSVGRHWARRRPRLVWCRQAQGEPDVARGPSTDEVHLWSFDSENESLPQCTALLPDAELESLLRLPDPAAFRLAVVARAKLRGVLAGYLGADPARLEIIARLRGRFQLAPAQARGLEFNLSYSGSAIVLVVTRGRLVGVDIEKVRPLQDLEGAMSLVLTNAEQVEVRSQSPGPARTIRFFQFWTRKEAYLKAVGRGIGLGMRDVDALALGSGPSVGAPGTTWSVENLDLGEGMVGAVVTQSLHDG
ncbi:MAG: 4'-phosphopantetheinyl transferase superfamily protein [Ramlibacter sp.]|nr:4'-phosphopantetheinyl transferase superfamily protein [Ramlibacter sp.]